MTEFSFHPIISGEPHYGVSLVKGPWVGSINLTPDFIWIGRLGSTIGVTLGHLEDRQAAAESLLEASKRYRKIQLFADRPEDCTIDQFIEHCKARNVPRTAQMVYAECGDHDITIEWMEES